MKIIKNNLIPFKGFKAINLFGILLVRGDQNIDMITMNHEKIHTEQIKEMLYIFYYIGYLIEWLIKLIFYGKKSYRHISFEQEAYQYENSMSYLERRKSYCWVKYLFS